MGYRLFWGIGLLLDWPLDSIDIYMIDSMLLWMMIWLWFIRCLIMYDGDSG
jgi:hypothetical protein